MIYLIDDNEYGQMSQNYKADFVLLLEKQYSGVVTWLTSIETNQVDDILSKAKCVLIHDSISNKDTFFENVKEKSIPYCSFSNGFTATVFYDGSIRSIKKDRMYCNLIPFLDKIVSEQIIDLKILSLGINYDIERSLIIQDKLAAIIMNTVPFVYENAFPNASQAYKDLYELVHLSGMAFSDFDQEYNTTETTEDVISSKIAEMVRKTLEKYAR